MDARAVLQEEGQMIAAEPLAVSVNEAARRLSLSSRTVATLISTNVLSSIKVGRRRVIPMKSLEDFLRRDHGNALPKR
jgi:excisionase family DNA binding protein